MAPEMPEANGPVHDHEHFFAPVSGDQQSAIDGRPAQPRSGQRAAATTMRLLNGAGSASILFYRTQPAECLEYVAHGFTADGRLVIGTYADNLDRSVSRGAHQVRLEVMRNASRFDIRVLSSSVHLLGTLRWLDDEARRQLSFYDELPSLVRSLAGMPEATFAEISFDRAILHDPSGVYSLPHGSLTDDRLSRFPAPADELDCHAIVDGMSNDRLSAVCQAVVEGRVAGEICARCPVMTICDRVVDQVVCADVDRLGMTLMHIGRDEMTTVFAEFSNPVENLTQLRAEIELLESNPTS